MTKTATVRTRIKPDPKESAEHVFCELGLNPTQAITLFYRQVELRHGLPFDVVVSLPRQFVRRSRTLMQVET